MIIIFGGSSGIGKEIKDYFRLKGNNIYSISRSNPDGDNQHIYCDIKNYESIKLAYKEINKLKKNVTALINCAGIASMNLALTTPPKVSENIIQTNLLGTIFCNQIFAPLLIKNKSGRIINFSTIAVKMGLKGESVYVASKSGVEGFSRVLSNELSSFNITVNCIAPGPIRTNLIKNVSEDQIKEIINHQIIKKEMGANEVVKIVDLLLKDESSKITGQVLHVGGF
tara:strand:- start:1003 stop:1680 length:678 start_codon:yes stop_codon:yes gene_type:complete